MLLLKMIALAVAMLTLAVSAETPEQRLTVLENLVNSM